MVSEAAHSSDYLGPATEARFGAAFAHRAILSVSQAADLIGVDVKTLPGLPIRSVPKGAHRGYTERDLRRYLTEEPAAECAPPKPQPIVNSRPRPARSNLRVVNFSERQRAKKA